jgi:hypothetical protein
MARGRSVAVGPRGSCCRQYVGSSDYWFELNVTRQHKEWPEHFGSSFIRERCSEGNGELIASRKQALEYCMRRRNEIYQLQEELLADTDTRWESGVNNNSCSILATSREITRLGRKRKQEQISHNEDVHRRCAIQNNTQTKKESRSAQEEINQQIEEICALSLTNDWHGPTTIPGVRNALAKLVKWSSNRHNVQSIEKIDGNLIKLYATEIRKTQPKTARKDLSYLSSIFQCGIEHGYLPGPNPCLCIPKAKRSERKKAAQKTFDRNNSLTRVELHDLDQLMLRDKQSSLYLLQRFTGARQQEVAGLRHCDFRDVNGYRCIVIEAHESRGMGLDGQTSGIKTPQSQRAIPLPPCLDQLWEEMHSDSKNPCFPKNTNERTHGENYRARYHNKAMRKGLPAGTHSLRETMIQTLVSNGIREYTIRCITGKTMPMADYVHEDIPRMAEAIALYAELMPLWSSSKDISAQE